MSSFTVNDSKREYLKLSPEWVTELQASYIHGYAAIIRMTSNYSCSTRTIILNKAELTDLISGLTVIRDEMPDDLVKEVLLNLGSVTITRDDEAGGVFVKTRKDNGKWSVALAPAGSPFAQALITLAQHCKPPHSLMGHRRQLHHASEETTKDTQ